MTDREGTGCVVESYGRRVVVERSDGARLPCKLKRKNFDLVAGDDVRIALSPGDDEWTVTVRLPRRNVRRLRRDNGVTVSAQFPHSIGYP